MPHQSQIRLVMLLKVLINVLIVGLFLFSKLLPYKDRLDSNNKDVLGLFENIFTPLSKALGSFIKPFQVGQGLSLDMTQIVLLILLLVLNSLFR